MPKAYNIYIANTRENLLERKELELALKGLKRSNKQFELMSEPLPGTDYANAVATSLAKADIILPLISVDFTASDLFDLVEPYCASEKKVLMPILAKSCLWKDTAFGKRGQALPDTDDGNAVFMDVWAKGRDDAITDIVNGINDIINHLSAGKSPNAKIDFTERDPKLVEHITTVRAEDAQVRKSTLWKKRIARLVVMLAVLLGLWFIYIKTTLIPHISGIEAYMGLSGGVSCGIFLALTIIFANKLGGRKKKMAIMAVVAGLMIAAVSGFLYLNELDGSTCIYTLSAESAEDTYMRRYVTGPLENISDVARNYIREESGNNELKVANYGCDRLIDEFSVNMINEIWQPANIKTAETSIIIKLIVLIISLAGTIFALTELSLPVGDGS